MAKHKHGLTVEKHEGMECSGCDDERSKKTTAISGWGINGAPLTLHLCSKCLAWVKGKLQGF